MVSLNEYKLLDEKNPEHLRFLKTPTYPILPNEIENLVPLIQKMYDIMHSLGGIGLAANQIGVDKHLFVMDIPDGEKGVFMNTSIMLLMNRIVFNEGCLSFPDQSVNTVRGSKVRIKYMTLDGDMTEMEFSGLAAICVQHEVDHLNGKTMHDSSVEVIDVTGHTKL
jgi:peptide deformylase